MGSRRRGPGNGFDDLPSSSSNQESALQLLPGVKQGQSLDFEDYLGHNKWRVKRKPVVHPALTNFGPESLQVFLQNELVKLRDAAQELPSKLKQEQEQLRAYALSLINAPGNLIRRTENGHRVFKVAGAKQILPPPQNADEVPRSRKGKEVVRGQRQQSTTKSPTKTSTNRTVLKLAKDHDIDMNTDFSNAQELPRTIGASRRLSRTSSFENHASSLRTTQRSQGVSRTAHSQFVDETKRRRKTPLSPKPANIVPPAVEIGLPISLDACGVQSTPARSTDHNASSSASSSYTRPCPDELASPSEGVLADEKSDRALMQAQRTISDDLYIHETQTVRPLAKIEKQQASVYSIHERRAFSTRRRQEYDYAKLIPEQMPNSIRQSEINRCTIWQAFDFDARGKLIPQEKYPKQSLPFTNEQLDPLQHNFLNAPDNDGDYPRRYEPSPIPRSAFEPPNCLPKSTKTSLPFEIWEAGVLQYLSSVEVRNLRLVCKDLASDLEPYVFRNVVAKFGPSLFNLNPRYNKDGKLDLGSPDSMLGRHGPDMNKFGITAEYDHYALMHAPFKATETIVNAWFGRYVWPVADYPYFTSLKEIDKLLDDERRLLTQGMSNLKNCSELAISVDSGHGWLEGPDLSDLALYRNLAHGGDKVFGKTFPAPDRAFDDGMKQYFKWAQRNTINESIKYLDSKSNKARDELARLKSIAIRGYDSYRAEHKQPDYVQHLHTGGVAPTGTDPVQTARTFYNNAMLTFMHGQPFINPQPQATQPPPQQVPLPAGNMTGTRRRTLFTQVMQIVNNHPASMQTQRKSTTQDKETIQPQWPIIFNGFNLASESRGDAGYVQSRVASASEFPLLPSSLTEPQAQWLMETSWIQRTFLSAYTDAVRINSYVLKNVHSLHIAKISSGLLPALSQKAFWSSLQNLKKVTLMVKPDWRVEHIPGDKFFRSTMATSPINAAYKFAELLRGCVAKMENINSLHIGYAGGGEHQLGMFGRNQHVLPAPITSNPRAWLIAQNSSQPKPNGNTMFVFPHIRTLTFENCWFSPYMLEAFMEKSRDTSLHNLVLDSVSLTSRVNSTRNDGPLRTVDHRLTCQHTASAWLNESIPINAAWVHVLDKLTPGSTIIDKRYDAGLIDTEANPRPERQFKGNVQQVTLKSCGYVKIMGVPGNEFNQNELVGQNVTWTAMDEALKMRASTFTKVMQVGIPDLLNEELKHDGIHDSSHDNAATSTIHGVEVKSQEEKDPRILSRFIMLSGRQGHARGESISNSDDNLHPITLTGVLTQCIHPVEKRVLEQMWGMRFGWGDDMRRWEAVEDGYYMGGTGRFSGEVFKDAEQQEVVMAALSAENEYETEDNARCSWKNESPRPASSCSQSDMSQSWHDWSGSGGGHVQHDDQSDGNINDGEQSKTNDENEDERDIEDAELDFDTRDNGDEDPEIN